MPVKKGGRNLLAIDECRSKVLLEGPGWVNNSTWLGEQTSEKLKERFQYFSPLEGMQFDSFM
jgi:hypothetical protein